METRKRRFGTPDVRGHNSELVPGTGSNSAGYTATKGLIIERLRTLFRLSDLTPPKIGLTPRPSRQRVQSEGFGWRRSHR